MKVRKIVHSSWPFFLFLSHLTIFCVSAVRAHVQIKQAFHLTMLHKELHNLPLYPEPVLNMMSALFSYTMCIPFYTQDASAEGKNSYML
jgi:hypothetical protein